MNTWFHPHNVQMKGQLGVRRTKSTQPALRYKKLPNRGGYWNRSSCVHQALQVWLYVCWIYGKMESGDLPAVLTFIPACRWHGDSQGVCEARGCPAATGHSFTLVDHRELKLLQRPSQNSQVEHLTSLTASGNTEQPQQKDLWVRWHLYASVKSCAQHALTSSGF